MEPYSLPLPRWRQQLGERPSLRWAVETQEPTAEPQQRDSRAFRFSAGGEVPQQEVGEVQRKTEGTEPKAVGEPEPKVPEGPFLREVPVESERVQPGRTRMVTSLMSIPTSPLRGVREVMAPVEVEAGSITSEPEPQRP